MPQLRVAPATLAVAAAFLAIARADEFYIVDDDPPPAVVPASELPAAPVQNVGPWWAPGADSWNRVRVGSPYYWSASPAGVGNYGWSGTGWKSVAPGMWDGYGSALEYEGCRPFASGAVPWGADSGPAGIDPYTWHFGPGFHRHSDYGHYRFPYYSYRRPWYSVGPPSYNRDTNFPW